MQDVGCLDRRVEAQLLGLEALPGPGIAGLLRHLGDLGFLDRAAVGQTHVLDKLAVGHEAHGHILEFGRHVLAGHELVIADRLGLLDVADAVYRAEALMHVDIAVDRVFHGHIRPAGDRAGADVRGGEIHQRRAVGDRAAVARHTADVLAAADAALGIGVADGGAGIARHAADVAAVAALNAAVALAAEHQTGLGAADHAADAVLAAGDAAVVDVVGADALGLVELVDDAVGADGLDQSILNVELIFDAHRADDAADVAVALDAAAVLVLGDAALGVLLAELLGNVVKDLMVRLAVEGVGHHEQHLRELIVRAAEILREDARRAAEHVVGLAQSVGDVGVFVGAVAAGLVGDAVIAGNAAAAVAAAGDAAGNAAEVAVGDGADVRAGDGTGVVHVVEEGAPVRVGVVRQIAHLRAHDGEIA